MLPPVRTSRALSDSFYAVRLLAPTSIVRHRYGLTPRQRIAKRALDLSLAAIALALTLPLIVTVALALKYIAPNAPIMRKTPIIGKGGRVVSLYRFRVPQTPGSGWQATLAHGLLHFGFDMLPLLLNIITGDLSLVGPRPQKLSDYNPRSDLQRVLLLTAPGVLGWQEFPLARTTAAWAYVEHYSLSLDVKIILRALHGTLEQDWSR